MGTKIAFPRSMTAERFWAKGVRQPNGCLLWLGKAHIGPYGVVGYRGKTWLAHRLAFHFTHGSIAPGVVVRHWICDTPRCIEPTHLRGGSHADNVADKVRHGRQRHGASHPLARLTSEQVAEIRTAYGRGDVMQKTLADEYGVSKQQVSKIIRGLRWFVKGD